MRRIVLLGVVAIVVLLATLPSGAGPRRGPEVEVFIGPGPVYRYPPPYYVYPAPPIVYGPPVYVPAPVYVAPPPPAPAAYWYYCPSYGDYYPRVPACPQAWVPVPVR
jgi:hypothetical protein